MIRGRFALLLAGAALLAQSGDARAAGTGRPTPGSARAFGFGGAFTAIADDPTALFFNPAGLALQARDTILAGASLVVPQRTYTPDEEGAEPQESHASPNFVPVLGYVTRLSSRGLPSRLALGFTFLNTLGGSGSWDPVDPESGVSAVNEIQNVVLEAIPGLAYELNDVLSLGFGLRVGIGLFSADTANRGGARSAVFSGTGLGAGFSLGAMLRPIDRFQVGLVYRSAMEVPVKGDGDMVIAPSPDARPIKFSTDQRWPQSAGLGGALRLGRHARISAQIDWVDWSAVDRQVILLDQGSIVEQVEDLSFRDSIALHAGAGYEVSPVLELRGGYTFDSNATPERTLSRQLLTGPMHGLAIGTGYRINRHLRLDAAAEILLGSDRTVTDNSADYEGWPDRANANPGTFGSSVFALELDLQYQF